MLLYQPPSHTYTCEIDATPPAPVPMRNVRAVSFVAVSAFSFAVEVEWELLDDIDEINGVLRAYDVCLGLQPLESNTAECGGDFSDQETIGTDDVRTSVECL